MSQFVKCEEKKPIIMKPADKEQAAKLLMTWAKRNKLYHTFKLATYMMLEIRGWAYARCLYATFTGKTLILQRKCLSINQESWKDV